MKFVIHPDARADLAEIADYYEHRLTGLGLKFTLAVREKLRQIVSNPRMFPEVDARRKLRRARTDGFPYAIEYRIEPARVHIIVVKHTARDPAYGRGRK